MQTSQIVAIVVCVALLALIITGLPQALISFLVGAIARFTRAIRPTRSTLRRMRNNATLARRVATRRMRWVPIIGLGALIFWFLFVYIERPHAVHASAGRSPIAKYAAIIMTVLMAGLVLYWAGKMIAARLRRAAPATPAGTPGATNVPQTARNGSRYLKTALIAIAILATLALFAIAIGWIIGSLSAPSPTPQPGLQPAASPKPTHLPGSWIIGIAALLFIANWFRSRRKRQRAAALQAGQVPQNGTPAEPTAESDKAWYTIFWASHRTNVTWFLVLFVLLHLPFIYVFGFLNVLAFIANNFLLWFNILLFSLLTIVAYNIKKMSKPLVRIPQYILYFLLACFVLTMIFDIGRSVKARQAMDRTKAAVGSVEYEKLPKRLLDSVVDWLWFGSSPSGPQRTARTLPAPSPEIETALQRHFARAGDNPTLLDTFRKISGCESGHRQFGPDGKPLRGQENPNATGVTQTLRSTFYDYGKRYHKMEPAAWDKYAREHGIHIDDSADSNLAFARLLYDKEGYRPWTADPDSFKCWYGSDVQYAGTIPAARPSPFTAEAPRRQPNMPAIVLDSNDLKAQAGASPFGYRQPPYARKQNQCVALVRDKEYFAKFDNGKEISVERHPTPLLLPPDFNTVQFMSKTGDSQYVDLILKPIGQDGKCGG